MTTEEEKTKNIDQEQNPELVKDSKISSKDDSLNKKMQEMYAESKKEVKTNQRPQSKYHRDRVPSGKRETEPKKEEHIDIDEDELIKKINEHFEKKQITKKEFSDNQNVFLPMDEFFELFKNIHLDLNDNEIKYLFSNKNPNKDDGYIYFNTFLDNYEFKFYPGESTLINKSNTDNQSNHSNYTSLLLNKPDKISYEVLSLVNQERVRNGLNKLSWGNVCADASEIRAVEISKVYSHMRPDGTTWDTACVEPKDNAKYIEGENLVAGNSAVSPETTVAAWMNSESHRANILNPEYTKLAVGFYYDITTKYRTHWTQYFSNF